MIDSGTLRGSGRKGAGAAWLVIQAIGDAATAGTWTRIKVAVTAGVVAALVALLLIVVILTTVVRLVTSNPFGGAPGQFAPSVFAVSTIPKEYLQLYERAGASYGVDWTIVAGVGYVECKHGASVAVGCRSGANSVGAMGPMQFMAGTWAKYGVDGNGDGKKDVYDPGDAIPAAGNYLKVLGADNPLLEKAALCHYNAGYGSAFGPCMVDPNPASYANLVLRYADLYRGPSIMSGPSPSSTWGFDVMQPVPRVGWIQQIPVPSFPPTVSDHLAISNQCVAGAYGTWWLMHRSYPQWNRYLELPGNAIDQVAEARSHGYLVVDQPEVGSMVVFHDVAPPFGHIATVVATDSGRFEVVEQNWLNTSLVIAPNWGTFSLHVFPWPDAGVSGFIAAPA